MPIKDIRDAIIQANNIANRDYVDDTGKYVLISQRSTTYEMIGSGTRFALVPRERSWNPRDEETRK